MNGEDSFFVDLETAAYFKRRIKTNYQISEFSEFAEKNFLYTDSSTKEDVKYNLECEWDGAVLERIHVVRRFSGLDELLFSLSDRCKQNGYDVLNDNFLYKLELIAHAKHRGAKILSVDLRDGKYSMKTLCKLFGVEICDPTGLDFLT